MLSYLFYKYITHKFALPDAIALAIELQSAGLAVQGDMLLAYACRLEGNHVLLTTNPWTNGSCYVAPLPPFGRLQNGDVWFDTVELTPHVRFQDLWLPLFPVYRWQYMGFVQASHYAVSSKNFSHCNKHDDINHYNLSDGNRETGFVLGLSALEIATYCHWFQKSPYCPAETTHAYYAQQLASTKIVLAGIPPQWELQGFYLRIDLSAENIVPQWQSIPMDTTSSIHTTKQNQYLPIYETTFATSPDADLMRSSNNRGRFPLDLTIPNNSPRPVPLIPAPLQDNQRSLSSAFKEYLSSNFSEPAVKRLICALTICGFHTYVSCLKIFFTSIGPSIKPFEKANRLFSAGTTFIGFYPPENQAHDNDAWFDLTELSPFLLSDGIWYPLKPVYWWQFACFKSCTSDTQNSSPLDIAGHVTEPSQWLQALPDLAGDTPVDRIMLPEAIAYAKWFGKKVFDPLTGPDKNAPFSTLLRPGWRLWSAVNFDEQSSSLAMAFDQFNRKLNYDDVFDTSSDTILPSAKWLFHPLLRHEKITFATTIHHNKLDNQKVNSLSRSAPRQIHANVHDEQNSSLGLANAFTDYLRDRSNNIHARNLCALLAINGFEAYGRLVGEYLRAGSPQLPVKTQNNPWSAADCYLGHYPPSEAENETVWFDVVELSPLVYLEQRWIPFKPVYTWQFIAFLHCCKYTIYDEWECKYRIEGMDNKLELLESLNLVQDPLSPAISIPIEDARAYARWFNKQLYDPFLTPDSIPERYSLDPSFKYLTDIFPSLPVYGSLIFDSSSKQFLSQEDIISADLQPSELSVYSCYEPHDAIFATCPDVVTGKLIPLDFELEKIKSIALLNQADR